MRSDHVLLQNGQQPQVRFGQIWAIQIQGKDGEELFWTHRLNSRSNGGMQLGSTGHVIVLESLELACKGNGKGLTISVN